MHNKALQTPQLTLFAGETVVVSSLQKVVETKGSQNFSTVLRETVTVGFCDSRHSKKISVEYEGYLQEILLRAVPTHHWGHPADKLVQ